jgi:hypothetical protein
VKTSADNSKEVVISSATTVVILSENCVEDSSFVSAIQSAQNASRRVILVHPAEDTNFPNLDNVPEELKPIFADKAVVYLSGNSNK